MDLEKDLGGRFGMTSTMLASIKVAKHMGMVSCIMMMGLLREVNLRKESLRADCIEKEIKDV